MKTHHVVEAEDAGVFRVLRDRGAKVPKRIAAQRLGVEGRQTPVLTFREERVRRRTDRDALREDMSVFFGVVAAAVHAEREVEIKTLLAQPLHLLGHAVLDVQVKPDSGFIVNGTKWPR